MAPSADAFPPPRAWLPSMAKLRWKYEKEKGFVVKGFGRDLVCLAPSMLFTISYCRKFLSSSTRESIFLTFNSFLEVEPERKKEKEQKKGILSHISAYFFRQTRSPVSGADPRFFDIKRVLPLYLLLN